MAAGPGSLALFGSLSYLVICMLLGLELAKLWLFIDLFVAGLICAHAKCSSVSDGPKSESGVHLRRPHRGAVRPP